MRIGIDASELIHSPTGVGRYLARLLMAWGSLAEAASHTFVLCAPAPPPLPDTGPLDLVTRVAPGHGFAWQQLTLPRLLRDAGADRLFAPAYTAPLLTRLPTVVCIHDVSFAAHPEWFGWREGLRLRAGTRISARRAARVLTVSEFSRREIVRWLGIDAARIDVTYHGVTALTREAAHPIAPPPTGERLVLYVGSLFNRRHVPELIEAFTPLALRHPELRLEIVGDNRTRPHIDIEALATATPVRSKIGLRPWAADDRLSVLYARAAAFVFLSEYEGFGMTPLEALAAGVPIVVLDTPVAREVYGPAAIYVERPEPALIEGALEQVLFDPRERARQLEAAGAVLARYSWRDCALRTLRALTASA